MKLMSGPVERRSLEFDVGDVTLLIELLEPVRRASGPRAAGPLVVALLDGPGAGWQEDLAGTGVARLPSAIGVARRQNGSSERVGTYALERLESGAGHYRWAPRPGAAPGVRST